MAHLIYGRMNISYKLIVCNNVTPQLYYSIMDMDDLPDTNQSSSDDDCPCEFEDHPYDSPSEDSINDDEVVDLDFSVFSMADHSSQCDTASIDTSPSVNSVGANQYLPNIPNSSDVDTENNTDWCSCGHCSPCSLIEAVCCQDRPEVRDFMQCDGECITDQTFFQGQLLSEDGLQYNRVMYASTISDYEERRKYLERDFDNRMRRQLCYRNFVLFINRGHPIGRGNRVVIPRCVVTEIRRQYCDPNGQYIGFIDSLNNA